jgi:adenylate cyclase
MFKKYSFLIIPLLSVVLSAFLFFTPLDGDIFNYFLRTIPSLTEDESVLLINIDDDSIDYAGLFPWTRDLYADALVFLREMGADTAAFDLNFLDNSPARIDKDYVQNDLMRYLEDGFFRINENAGEVIDSFTDGERDISNVEDRENAKERIQTVNNAEQDQLAVSINNVIIDTDEYLANALKFFGNSYLTLTMVTSEDLTGDEKVYHMDADMLSWLEDNIALKNVNSNGDAKTPEQIGIWPAIQRLMTRSGGAGFVNAPVDQDGYRRRIYLLSKHNGNYYSHLILSAMRNTLGNPQIEVDNSFVTLKNAHINGLVKDIVIPRAEDGSILIKWPKKPFSGYNTMSILNLIMYPRLEKVMAENLSLMAGNGFFDGYWKEDYTPYEIYQNAEYVKEILYQGEDNPMGVTFDMYMDYRKQYIDAVNRFLNEGYEEQILDDYADSEEIVAKVSAVFRVTREQFGTLLSLRRETEARTKGRLCIIGVDATSMTDLGLITFQERFPNVGTYAAVANMILSGEFLDDAPWFVSLLIALGFSFILAFIVKKLDIGKSIFAGITAMLFISGLIILIFIISKRYIGLAVPFTAAALTFLSLTGLNFFSTIREKSFLRSAFSRYLAPEVINQIIADPSKLNLGGEKREMTAIFTDIQSFSSISEKLEDPALLVELLNLYLTDMSNIVMEHKGTIDKFEGDAIIAFFGAPIHYDNHAELACRAAIQMKRKEQELKEKIISPGSPFAEALKALIEKGKIRSESPLYTRIGVNTGDMVVGNMGTPNKMDYTVMGDAVNLAARLEGINKQYNTGGILISEYTKNKIGDAFITRSLSRVRVVGKAIPIRLYELVDAGENEKPGEVNLWEQGIQNYENKDFTNAGQIFQTLINRRPNDGVARLYLDRCNKYLHTPPSDEEWDDGIDNLSSK